MQEAASPEVRLPAEPEAVRRAAAALDGHQDLDQARVLAASHPRSLLAWAVLGDAGATAIDRYAAYRVGYHRGLDALRGAGWRGAGRVPWTHEPNRGFLRCLQGLGEMAAVIGETNEADRVATFVAMLDPTRAATPNAYGTRADGDR